MLDRVSRENRHPVSFAKSELVEPADQRLAPRGEFSECSLPTRGMLRECHGIGLGEAVSHDEPGGVAAR
ncbi:MAG: hypothetical protein NVSMB13_02620 [Mycobacteriales bacterium]